MSQKINTEKLKLAEIRLFDTEKMASEIPSVHGYTFLYEQDGKYQNIFRGEDGLPVFERVPYSNSTLDGEDFGSKIILLQGDVQDGPCYIIPSTSGKILFGKEQISISELKTYILHSNYYFIDRLSIMEEEYSSILQWLCNHKKRDQDIKLRREFQEYFGNSSKIFVKK